MPFSAGGTTAGQRGGWYDLAWFAATHPSYNTEHLDVRLSHGGQMPEREHLTGDGLLKLATTVMATFAQEINETIRAPWYNSYYNNIVGGFQR